MFRLDDQEAARFCAGPRRRDLLRAGSLGTLGLSLPNILGREAQGAVETGEALNVILLLLVGGPSQLDTWDMKPDAPSEFRGPYRPIKTNVPGVEISEIFPRMACHADKYAILRSLHHSAAAVHDVGHQLVQTGRVFRGAAKDPHMGCVVARLSGSRADLPPHVLLPGPIGHTGGNMPHGQDAGYLGAEFDPVVVDAGRGRAWREPEVRAVFNLRQESEETRARYGHNRFGRSCLLARRLIKAGVRFVTINMFETVFDQISWDVHGWRPFSPAECYSDYVGPMFDNGFTSLIEDLAQTGELDSTLILATGEFGRTPRINPAGGRDHWPQCWSMIMAGGGVQGGQILGESDEIGAEPKNRPITPAEVAATVYDRLGIGLDTELPGPGRRPIRIVDEGVEPLDELFV